MNQRTFFADGLLFLAALIWGTDFVAQSVGLDYMEPWSFNAVRFLIGSVALIPLMIYQRKTRPVFTPAAVLGGLAMGVVLTLAAGLQQVALLYTTAGKTAFITGLYIVLVPVMALVIGQKTGRDTWIGIMFALPGLGFLTLGDDFTLSHGDGLVVICSVFWALHLLMIDRLAPRHNVMTLAFTQFLGCSVLSFVIAGFQESWTFEQVRAGWIPLIYVGLLSTSVAYTLQIVGQKTAPVAHASIILSLETVFAVIAGYLFLNEVMSGQALFGCGLMLVGMIISQLGLKRIRGLLRRSLWYS